MKTADAANAVRPTMNAWEKTVNMKVFRNLLILLLITFAAVLLWGQPQAGQSDATDKKQEFGVEVNMVTVPVTVRKTEGGFLKGLSQNDFRIYEDEKPQEIVFFAQEALPTRIALVLDISETVRSEWGTIKYATKRFVENLEPEDKFSITTFNSDVRLKMDCVDPVLSSIYCKDLTKLWEAIWVVSNNVFDGIEEKKAMIIMSDGLDTDSAVSYDEALQAAVRSESAIYVVSKTEAVRQLMINLSKKNPHPYNGIPQENFAMADTALRKLAYETGGRMLYPNSFGQLDNVYAQVYEELRNQYTLGYVSTNTAKDGSYRHINVGVNAQNIKMSARPGYYSTDALAVPTRPKNRL
jgi:Ca-activated chloride channel family protein